MTWGGRFLCTINMKSYEILDLASHFSRKDAGWGRVETSGHPWFLVREPLSLRPKAWLRHPRPPTRAAPARHKTRTHQKRGVGRQPACGQSIQRYMRSGPWNLHKETKLRALCFGFTLFSEHLGRFLQPCVCVFALCWAWLRIPEARPRKMTWKVYGPYLNSPIKGNVWVCLLLLLVGIIKSEWINADYSFRRSRNLDLDYDFPCHQFELLPLCQRYFKRINEGLWRKKALSPTPKWTKLIKLLEPTLWHLLYIVTFYGPKADID